jgi:hypothetical protein
MSVSPQKNWLHYADHPRIHYAWVFRTIVTARFGIVTDHFGNVTGDFGRS